MSYEDFEFLQTCLNFGTILLAAIVIAFTRHGEPEPTNFDEPSRLVQFLYAQDADYINVREREDRLTESEKQILAQMVTEGAALSFRGAQAHGIGRAGWNRIRAALINMGLADQTPAGELLLTPAALEYLRVPNE
jgi:hypothetical protein